VTAVHELAIAATVFGVIFLAELPDKSLFASLILSTRYRRLPVWAGAASAFTVHVAVAVVAGQLLTLLPHRLLAAVVAGLFLIGAGYILVSSFRGGDDEDADAARQGSRQPSFARVFATAFGVIFLAEWGDITQITVANFAARYAAPVAVGIGAVLALASVAAVAVNVGAQSLKVIPMAWVQRVIGTVLLGFGVYSAVQAITG
jgi:putative Ca2+/H+ antiporter (TMEM165/GDT1 family)